MPPPCFKNRCVALVTQIFRDVMFETTVYLTRDKSPTSASPLQYCSTQENLLLTLLMTKLTRKSLASC